MNAVGIDVSKGKSTVAILRPGGEVVASPFEVSHNPRELNGLVTLMKSLDGDTKIVMEYTGNYYLPVALFLRKVGLFVSVVNPILVKDYSNKFIAVHRSIHFHFATAIGADEESRQRMRKSYLCFPAARYGFSSCLYFVP